MSDFYIVKVKSDARSAVEKHIQSYLNGSQTSWKDDSKLKELYAEWQAACAAFSAKRGFAPYPIEVARMPQMPIDDGSDALQPCRQMAAVLILRTIYNEDIAAPWFHKAAENIKKNPSCAGHFYTCACKKALEGWGSAENLETVKELNVFYDMHCRD